MNPRRGRTHKGQIAVGLMVLTGFILVLLSFSVKLGQISQVRVETSNAADAGALAAASWIVSGQNEAALMTQKMLDAVTMVQAIYLEPFCPGSGQRDYAEALWRSLLVHPDPDPEEAICGRAEPTGPYDFRGCGPVGYFRETANGVMEAAWNMGRREFFTSAVNNLMIRTQFGPEGESPSEFVQRIGVQKIKEQQERLQSQLPDLPSLILTDLDWHNGRIDNSQTPPVALDGFRYHVAWIDLHDYPSAPPQMRMAWRSWTYYQYQPAEPEPDPDEEFPCSFPAWGIRDTDATGPVADIQQVSPLPEYPLAVKTTGPEAGQKNWDLDLAEIIPAIGHSNPDLAIDVGLCDDQVCGDLVVRPTGSQEVSPFGILRDPGDLASFYEGDLTVMIAHRVSTATELDEDGGRPVLDPIPDYPLVLSEATVHYEVAERSGLVINPTANAYLIEAE